MLLLVKKRRPKQLSCESLGIDNGRNNNQLSRSAPLSTSAKVSRRARDSYTNQNADNVSFAASDDRRSKEVRIESKENSFDAISNSITKEGSTSSSNTHDSTIGIGVNNADTKQAHGRQAKGPQAPLRNEVELQQRQQHNQQKRESQQMEPKQLRQPHKQQKEQQQLDKQQRQQLPLQQLQQSKPQRPPSEQEEQHKRGQQQQRQQQQQQQQKKQQLMQKQASQQQQQQQQQIRKEQQRRQRRRVRFSSVIVQEYSLTIGDHPLCKGAFPLTMAWEHTFPQEIDISKYGTWSSNNRNNNSGILTPLKDWERIDRLRKVTGLTDSTLFFLEHQRQQVFLNARSKIARPRTRNKQRRQQQFAPLQ